MVLSCMPTTSLAMVDPKVLARSNHQVETGGAKDGIEQWEHEFDSDGISGARDHGIKFCLFGVVGPIEDPLPIALELLEGPPKQNES